MAPDGDRARGNGNVLVASTGNDSEMKKELPITRQPGDGRRVVMSLRPGGQGAESTPDLQPGDRLLVFAEAEVTTDHPEHSKLSRGRTYGFAPEVNATLLLASSKQIIASNGRGRAIASSKRSALSHEEHHGVFFMEAGQKLSDDLPWALRDTCINLVLDANHPRGGNGEVLLVGENQEDGSVGHDKGRISVVRLRGEPQAKTFTVDKPAVPAVPLKKGTETIVFSQELDRLRENEQLVVRAKLKSSAKKIGYRARISTRIGLVTENDAKAKNVATFDAEVAENNGFNCLPGVDAYETNKAGVLRITKNVGDPLFIKMFAVCADPVEQREGREMELLSGSMKVYRYPPGVYG